MFDKAKVVNFFKAHGQRIINIDMFVTFGLWSLWSIYQIYMKGNLNFVEISFVGANVIMAFLFLVRRAHKEFNTNIFHQTIALIAFCSGAGLIGMEPTGNDKTLLISTIIIVASNIIGLITLFNLGKSFGVFIAFREIKTRGLYGIVRHPMYFTDILLRVGYIISHFSLYTVSVALLSTACYVYRAMLEERFLSKQEEYADYMKKVRYRFIPYIF